MFKKTINTILSVDGVDYPVKVHYEPRNGWRASFGKKNIIFRIPSQAPEKLQTEHLNRMREWAIKHIRKNPNISSRYFGKQYKDGDALFVGDRRYILNIKTKQRKSSKAELKDSTIFIILSNNLDDLTKEAHLKNLITKIVANDFFPSFQKRVLDLNEKHFKQPITSIKIRYTVSKWGSCTSKNQLNFSTRLLLMPQDVIDYVIIHELSHLIEHNHSPRFWNLVKQAMPNYKEKEKWLKQNGKEFDF